MLRTSLVLLTLLLTPLAFAQDDDELPPIAEQRARLGNLSGVGLQRETFDLNRDGDPDQLHFSRRGLKVRVERDFNFDGRTDTFEHYDDGRLVEEELDLDFDGQVDAVRLYKGKIVEIKEYAVGFRQQMAITMYHDAQGRLERVERDTNDDQAVDVWERYHSGAEAPFEVRIDVDYDGTPDRTISLEDSPTPLPPSAP